MNIKTTGIMLITASTLFTGCVSEVVEAIKLPVGDNNTTKELNATSPLQRNMDSKKAATSTAENPNAIVAVLNDFLGEIGKRAQNKVDNT